MRYVYSDEFKKLKIAQYLDLKKMKCEGYIVVYKDVMGRFANLVSQWIDEFEGCKLPEFKNDRSMFEIKVENVGKEYRCMGCGKTFTSLTVRKYCCNNCASRSSTTKKSSICFDCKNYFKCKKFECGNKVIDCMIEYEFKQNNEVLSVYECKLYRCN